MSKKDLGQVSKTDSAQVGAKAGVGGGAQASAKDLGPASSGTSLSWRVPEWFSDLDQKSLDKLHSFQLLLEKFNRALNLVSEKTLPQSDNVHFSDSILACRAIVGAYPKIDQIYDIGIGNGFPGIVMAILFPSIQVVGVDIDIRKGEFLKQAAHDLGLKNFSMKTQHLENLAEGEVRYGVSRGFASLSKSLVLARKAFGLGGVYFHMKSEDWSSEVASIPIQVCGYWQPALVKQYRLPQGEIEYALVKTERI